MQIKLLFICFFSIIIQCFLSLDQCPRCKVLFTEFEFMNILNQFLQCKIILHRNAATYFKKKLHTKLHTVTYFINLFLWIIWHCRFSIDKLSQTFYLISCFLRNLTCNVWGQQLFFQEPLKSLEIIAQVCVSHPVFRVSYMTNCSVKL